MTNPQPSTPSPAVDELRRGYHAIEVRMAEMQGTLKSIEQSYTIYTTEIKQIKDRLEELQEFRARNADIDTDIDELKAFMWRALGGISLGVILIEAVIFYLASSPK